MEPLSVPELDYLCPTMYKVQFSDSVIPVEMDAQHTSVNGQPFEVDAVEFRQGRFHLLVNRKSYTAEIIQFRPEEKSVVVRVNNSVFTMQVRDKYDDLLREMGIDVAGSKKVNDMKAPMPGLVLNVMVEEGQSIAKGDPILVLEAMKMENIIKSPADAVIKKVAIRKGDKVEKNQVMITLA